MTLVRTLTFAVPLAVALAATSGARAQAQDQIPTFEERETVSGEILRGAPSDHHLTFSGPFAIPGVSLPPGTYVFRVPARNVIQVLSPDRASVYAMFLTIPATRPEATGEYEVRWERQVEAPPRLKTWFLPDQTVGNDLIYPGGTGRTTDLAG